MVGIFIFHLSRIGPLKRFQNCVFGSLLAGFVEALMSWAGTGSRPKGSEFLGPLEVYTLALDGICPLGGTGYTFGAPGGLNGVFFPGL